jgi:hypothetical protein
MNSKKAKKLRKVLKASALPEVQLVQNPATGQIRTGRCKRTLYKFLKARMDVPFDQALTQAARRYA